ncbi:6-phospho-3-hexuloisomerase [Bacillus infantis]|uniref:6-phospho-3-hexuloisomerase n=1 Tax=Bacillus infantis TaxID=324767 RepID=UPI000B9A71ED|nr:6-phospho-3-hexuloisomerase [Bacillus infantis]MCK6208776.1 6-phospho-3-hexuloisomerase [Bacillus infantis]OXT16638.1 6-phospho-3-hexuloisomerase [Bacillus sp. OG2]
MKNIIETISNEISTVLSKVSPEEGLAVSQELKSAKRIFVYGEGRSGLMGKAFAMRLMHGGYEVYAVGETITPSIGKGDLLVAISGSGSTGMIYEFAAKAKEIGARVVLVTTSRESKIAKISDRVLVIPAATKYRRPEEPATIQPLGNQFDQSVHLVLDGIIIHSLQEKEDMNDEMRRKHSNLE